jgi:hypothetical protein
MRLKLHYVVVLLLAGLLAGFAVGCGDDDDGDTQPADTATVTEAATEPATPSSEASISITEPADGWTAEGDRIEVRVGVEGVELDGTKIGLPAADNPGVAHWHVYVDDQYAGLSVSDVISLPNDALPTIAAGSHEVRVQLHNTDHTPLVPEAADAISVEVPQDLAIPTPAGEPSIAIVSPDEGATVDSRVEVRVAVTGVLLDGTKIGSPANENPGVGHWHVYVDGEYAGLSVSDVVSLPNDAMTSISPGTHEIKVQLHHTDHTPLTPEQSHAVTVTFP